MGCVGEWITISHSPHCFLPLQEAEDGKWWQHVPVMRQWAGAGDAGGEDAFDWCIQFVPMKTVHSVCARENGAFSLCQWNGAFSLCWWKQISVDVDTFKKIAILHSQADSLRSLVIQVFCLSDSLFSSAFFTIHQSGVLTLLTWLLTATGLYPFAWAVWVIWTHFHRDAVCDLDPFSPWCSLWPGPIFTLMQSVTWTHFHPDAVCDLDPFSPWCSLWPGPIFTLMQSVTWTHFHPDNNGCSSQGIVETPKPIVNATVKNCTLLFWKHTHMHIMTPTPTPTPTPPPSMHAHHVLTPTHLPPSMHLHAHHVLTPTHLPPSMHLHAHHVLPPTYSCMHVHHGLTPFLFLLQIFCS